MNEKIDIIVWCSRLQQLGFTQARRLSAPTKNPACFGVLLRRNCNERALLRAKRKTEHVHIAHVCELLRLRCVLLSSSRGMFAVSSVRRQFGLLSARVQKFLSVRERLQRTPGSKSGWSPEMIAGTCNHLPFGPVLVPFYKQFFEFAVGSISWLCVCYFVYLTSDLQQRSRRNTNATPATRSTKISTIFPHWTSCSINQSGRHFRRLTTRRRQHQSVQRRKHKPPPPPNKKQASLWKTTV